MATSYKKRILGYCASQGIDVPPGFGRNAPSQFAIIRTDLKPHKLVAKTWFTVADVVYYLENILKSELGDQVDTSIRIIDFKENQELEWNGSQQLKLKSSLT